MRRKWICIFVRRFGLLCAHLYAPWKRCAAMRLGRIRMAEDWGAEGFQKGVALPCLREIVEMETKLWEIWTRNRR